MERYGEAAWRHYRAATILEKEAEVDDAGYHLGMCGENAIKHALRSAGLEGVWSSLGNATSANAEDGLRGTPMRGHLPEIKDLLKKARVEIAIYASGRAGGVVQNTLLDPGLPNRFGDWNIKIRYADTSCTPVTPERFDSWHNDAEDLLLSLFC